MEDQIKELYRLNKQLIGIADKLLVSKTIKDERSVFACFALVKGYKTQKSIIVLCQSGFGEDAFMHSRTLFELSIICSFILQDKTGLRLKRYIDHEAVMRKAYLERSSLGTTLGEELNTQILNDLEAAMSSHEYSKWRGRWSEETIDEMAEKVERGHEYKTLYKMQCNLAHSHVVSMDEYVVQDASNEKIMNLGTNFDMIKTALVASFDSFRWILGEFNKEYDIGENLELEKACEEFNVLTGKM